ncbi:MAG: hypothetical protein Q4B48_02530 [Syntrophomonadaceae bacterium]|nr:hypothetical protein [Syntrophomonadaceae bacterium]
MPARRNLFPGSNTCYGYHSFYEYLATADCRRKLIIKGGPGTGKSSLMKKVGEHFLARGAAIEYHWCSSDPQSLDGLVVRGKNGFCLLDGTAPHVTDPSCPGAYDEVVNMGSFWNGAALRRGRGEIEELTGDIGGCFSHAYLRLQEAHAAVLQYVLYIKEAIDEAKLLPPLRIMAEDYLSACPTGTGIQRHLFAAAVGPEGVIHHMDTVCDAATPVFAVRGATGTGPQLLFDMVLQQSEWRGIALEVFHCPFDPRYIDAVLAPGGPLLLNLSPLAADYESRLIKPRYERWLDLDSLLSPARLATARRPAEAAWERCGQSLFEATELLAAARQKHDALEAYYTAAMDFERMNMATDHLLAELDDFWREK